MLFRLTGAVGNLKTLMVVYLTVRKVIRLAKSIQEEKKKRNIPT